MNAAQRSKEAAGRAAAALVKDGMRLGLGTGSTVDPFLVALADRRTAEGLDVLGVATSERTAQRSRELGIPLSSLDRTQELDLVVDGADEVDPQFRLIKGGGGALLREKLVASAGRCVVIVVGEGKRVDRLGCDFLLPVEVVPFGSALTSKRIASEGCQAYLRSGEDGEPFHTDNGNFIFDCRFEEGIFRPEELHRSLLEIPGVVEVGLFLDLCHKLLEGRSDGSVQSWERESAGGR